MAPTDIFEVLYFSATQISLNVRVIAMKFRLTLGFLICLLCSLAPSCEWLGAQPAPSKVQGLQTRRLSTGSYSTRDNVERDGCYIFLDIPMIRRELDITHEQEIKLAELEKAVQKLVSKPINFPGNLSDHELRLALRAQLTDEHDRAGALKNSGIGRVLTSSQNQRLRGIAVQLVGPFAVTWPEIQKTLNMSEEQTLNISILAQEYNSIKVDIFRKRNFILDQVNSSSNQTRSVQKPVFRLDDYTRDLENLQQDLSSLRRVTSQKILRYLTKGQKEKLEKIRGKPFDGLSQLNTPGFDWKRDERGLKDRDINAR